MKKTVVWGSGRRAPKKEIDLHYGPPTPLDDVKNEIFHRFGGDHPRTG